MELRYVVLTIIKILISVPAVLIYQSHFTNGAALMGGHLDNKNNASNLTDSSVVDYENQEYPTNFTDEVVDSQRYEQDSEEIPDPEPLVLPGYNLPENIFNKGKPFYLEKDPLTGQVDFASKTSSKLDDDMYEYVDEEPNSEIYDKANIDRKDGSLSGHRPSDVNQLTPNFHDFLNLPVKYNSDKYVYPLISSSYANTKIQGNINRYHNNHKDYNVKTSTHKPIASPTYYNSNKNNNYFTDHQKTTQRPTASTTTSTLKPTTQIYFTSKVPNLMYSPINHPSFHTDFEDYYEPTTKNPKLNEMYSTTKSYNDVYLTTKGPVTTTKRPMSLFEQLFGDYEESITTTQKTVSTIKNTKNKYESEIKTEKPSYTTPSGVHHPNSHAGSNVLNNSSNMAVESSYDYKDEQSSETEHLTQETNNKTVKDPQSTTTTTTKIPMTTKTTKQSTTMSTTPISYSEAEYDEYDYQDKQNQTIVNKVTTSTEATTIKVTSLPLGENHVTSLNNHQPIIVATQNLRDQLMNEKVPPKPFELAKPVQQPPSTSNIHIAPDQDTVSFVVGHHQSVDGGQYVGTTLKESPYDSNPFRPLYGQQSQDTVSYTIQAGPLPHFSGAAGSSVTIQPQMNSEASLAIGVPVGGDIKQKPGQVVDEKLELDNHNIQFPQNTGNKIVFPDDTKTEVQNLLPSPNREVLKLNSKPMYHQLPSDLTPPKEKEVLPPLNPIPTRLDRPRPPWDPRPGHFYSGKPEYVRPPRPPPEIQYKRIDNLPNILPQFRPNMRPNNVPQHYLNRQPLLERPSNRPIGFFEKLQPPPPPIHLHNLRKIPPPPPIQSLDDVSPVFAEDRIINEGPPKKPIQDQFSFYQTPPKVVIANRRIGNVEGDVETLQMIQAKKSEKKDSVRTEDVNEKTNERVTDKPLYVVYPVNTPPIKMDVIDSNTKESVVIGTRAELPLPPSKINQNFDYAQNPILNPKDRNDAPVLKPHPRPTFPIKSDFPYPLERPDPSVLNPAVPETPSNNKLDEPDFSNNQWNTFGADTESRIVSKPNKGTNQISVTLKTYTEKPIALAYTPTEPYHETYDFDKYSMPNYGSPVIPEIRPGSVEDVGKPDNEFTVSAVMHTRPQLELKVTNKHKYPEEPQNHRSDIESSSVHSQDFQAPFQASVSVDSLSQGWSVVRDKAKSKVEAEPAEEVTTLPLATTSEFDIENFKPQLIGGFKPIYNFPEDAASKTKETEVSEREE